MDEQATAIGIYESIIQNSDMGEEKGIASARYYFSCIARCMASIGDYEGAISLLKEQLGRKHFREHKAEILCTMAKISKNFGPIDLFFVYGEAALQIEPLSEGIRFDLAYQYSEKGRRKLAFLHYKKLIDIGSTDGAHFNNLGVEYSHAGLAEA